MTRELRDEILGWIRTGTWQDIDDPAEFDELTDAELAAAIERQYVGGIEAFLDAVHLSRLELEGSEP